MKYEDLVFKIPVESSTYHADSQFVIDQGWRGFCRNQG